MLWVDEEVVTGLHHHLPTSLSPRRLSEVDQVPHSAISGGLTLVALAGWPDLSFPLVSSKLIVTCLPLLTIYHSFLLLPSL